MMRVRTKFMLFELFNMFIIPAIVVWMGWHLAEDGWVSYTIWVLAMLTLRGFLALLWDVYEGVRESY